MHLQLITFRLNDMTPEEYDAHCAAIAPRFAEIPGLRSKIWIAEPGTDVRGGAYLWENRAWAERHAGGPIVAAMRGDERFTDLAIRDLDVLAGPTAITRWGFTSLPA